MAARSVNSSNRRVIIDPMNRSVEYWGEGQKVLQPYANALGVDIEVEVVRGYHESST